MGNQKKSYERITSPKGKAMYPFLSKPDTKFDSDGVYRLNLIVSGDEGSDFVSDLMAQHEKHYDEYCEKEGSAVKKGSVPVKPVTDEDGMETGDWEIKFKLKAMGKSKDRSWEQRPIVYDSKATPITTDTLDGMNIGNGSECKVAFEVVPYYTGMAGMGLSLRLRAVQIIDLVEYAPSNDFAEEDGFVVETETSDF